MMTRAAAISELVEVLDRFTALSEGATRAAAAADVDALGRALDAREVVLQRARELVPILNEGAPIPAEVRQRIARLEEADRALSGVVTRAHAETRQELDRLGTTRVAVGGYAAAMPRFRRLDLRR